MLSILVRIAAIIFIVEMAAMLLLSLIKLQLPVLVVAIFDAVFLTLFSAPFIYLWVIKPYVIARLQSEKELRELNEKLESVIEERTVDFLHAKEEAERANNYKTEFLSRMSHEFRTPLNAILGYSQLLIEDLKQASNVDWAMDVERIHESGDHLLSLVNELLDLSRIETGRIDLSMNSISCQEILQECANLMEPLCEKRGIKLVYDVPLSENTLLLADSTRFKEVLLNLLSNAVKYNRENGHIILSIERNNNSRVRINVTDTGKGLDESQCKKLFIPFERLGMEYGNIAGTGIGLVITKQIVEIMGGDIGCESTPGKGSTFWIELNTAEIDYVISPQSVIQHSA